MTENKNITPNSEAVPNCRERAVMVAVIRDNQDPRQAEEFLDELEFLAETADIVSVKRFTQRLPQPAYTSARASWKRSPVTAGSSRSTW